jgi:ATP-dependent RNA helicase RhlE
MNTFSELSLSPALEGSLASARLTIPTAVQAAAIPPALEGLDVLATAQTGTGKTLAFLLPLVHKLSQSKEPGIQAVILVPTRELAMQVMEVFNLLKRGTGVESALVVGGLPEAAQLASIRRGARLMVATPGRLEDYLGRRLVRLDKVRMLVFDEADRMLDMGFLPAIKRIVGAMPTERQTLCFSATLEESTAPVIEKYMKNPVRVEIGSTHKPVDQVKLQWFEIASEQKTDLLRDLLDRELGTFLVFARTKHRTERLAKSLARFGYDAAMIHGDRSQNQRTAALKGFQSGKYRVLVATDIAARGIHVENIAHVVNYDMPAEPEDFIHRVGRTGRASEHGVASTFATRQESSEIRKIERALKLKIERLPVAAAILAMAPPELPEPQAVKRSFAPARRPATRRFYSAS